MAEQTTTAPALGTAPREERRICAWSRSVAFWSICAFCVSFALALAVNELLVQRMPAIGDEPWYLMQSYALLHEHTPSVAAIVNNPSLYHHFLHGRDDHSRDYLGNGERMLPDLPGYAALIALPYLIAGRSGVVGLQAALAALVAALLFAEATRLFSSRLAGGFAVCAYLGTLPAFLYVGQVFPSVAASAFMFCGFLLAVRALPEARGPRLIAASVLLGVLAFALPWLHLKYLLAALMLLALAVYALRSRLCWRRGASSDRGAWLACGIVAAAFLLSVALIALYSHRYYGSWTPHFTPQADAGVNAQRVNLQRGLNLYEDMFLSRQSGLFPWVPLYLLALPGLVLLWRRTRQYAIALLLALFGLLGVFLAAIVTPEIFQGLAYPSRFTVESAPFFALCVVAVFAVGVAALHQRFQRELHTVAADRYHRLLSALRARKRALGGIIVGCCLALCLIDSYFIGASLVDLRLLYGSTAGPRLVEEYPQLFPPWWFDAFPETPGVVASTRQLRINPQTAISAPTGATLYTPWLNVPPGAFHVTFTLSCAATSGAADAAASFHVERLVSGKVIQLVQSSVPSAALCTSKPTTMTLAFTSNGYQEVRFGLAYPATLSVRSFVVRYTPSP